MENSASQITRTEETRAAFKIEVSNNDYEPTLRHYWKQGYHAETIDVIRSGYRIHFRRQKLRQLELV